MIEVNGSGDGDNRKGLNWYDWSLKISLYKSILPAFPN